MLSRSHLFLSLMMIVLASLLLAACGNSSAQTQAVETDTVSDKSITIVIAEDLPSFNPIVADTGFDALVMELVMLGMTDVDPESKQLCSLDTPSSWKPV